MTHTPGPWHIDHRAFTVESNGEEWGLKVIRNGMRECCLVYEEDKANARLIAAAPDLLAALRTLINDPVVQVAVEDEDRFLAVVNQARAVIAKAEGPNG